MSEPFTLDTLLTDAALLSLEHQLHLEELLGEHSWQVDLTEPRFEFTGDHPLRCTAFHLLGTAAPGPASWLWSWANPGGFPPDVTALAGTVRDFGTEYFIDELADGGVAFADLPGAPDAAADAAWVLIEAAKIVSGSWTAYQGDAGGGTRAAFLVEHPDFALPPPSGPRVVRTIHQGVANPLITDHRRMIYAYATRRPLTAVADEDWSSVRLTAPGLDVTVTFDGARVRDISGTMEPT